MLNYGVPARGETFFFFFTRRMCPRSQTRRRKFRFESVRGGLAIDFHVKMIEKSDRPLIPLLDEDQRLKSTRDILQDRWIPRNTRARASGAQLFLGMVITFLRSCAKFTTSTDLIVIYAEMDQAFRELFVKHIIHRCICEALWKINYWKETRVTIFYIVMRVNVTTLYFRLSHFILSENLKTKKKKKL